LLLVKRGNLSVFGTTTHEVQIHYSYRFSLYDSFYFRELQKLFRNFRPALARRSIETADHIGHVLTGRTKTELNA